MPDLQSQPDASRVPDGQSANRPDPLSGLYHMSNTAGAGTQDYVAINPIAIASLMLGFGSALVVLSNILLVVPLAGIVCAVVAIVQIRRSSQTQGGTWLAFAGLLLSVLLGGGRVGYDAVTTFRISSDERQIAQILHDFGQDLAAARYEQAYQRLDDRFRERVTFATFEQGFKGFNNVAGLGGLKAVEWNHEPMIFEQKPDSGEVYGSAMSLFQFKASPQPSRLIIAFVKSGGTWHMDSIPDLFPAKKKP